MFITVNTKQIVLIATVLMTAAFIASHANAASYNFQSADSVTYKSSKHKAHPSHKPREWIEQSYPSYHEDYPREGVYKKVRVLDYEPVFVSVSVPEKKRSCYRKKKPVYSKHRVQNSNPNDVITGAIIGGILGNVATQKDKKAQPFATIVGAVAGASIADGKSKTIKEFSHYEYKNVCRTETFYREERQFSHYDVSYYYRGYRTVQMQEEPGRWITVLR